VDALMRGFGQGFDVQRMVLDKIGNSFALAVLRNQPVMSLLARLQHSPSLPLTDAHGSFTTFDISSHSDAPNEKEILIGSGSSFKITGWNSSSRVLKVTLL
jgi:hypothetical protein